MKKNKFIISSLSIFLCIVHLCCDTPEGEVSIHSGFKNTLGDESTGDGSSGKIENYFYKNFKYTNIILNAPGETVTCIFKNSNWNIIAGNGYTTS